MGMSFSSAISPELPREGHRRKAKGAGRERIQGPARGLIWDTQIFPEQVTGMQLHEGKGGEDFGQNPRILNEESSQKLRMDEGRAEVLGWMWTRHSSSRPPFLAPDENTALLEEGIAKGEVREVWRAIILNSTSAMMSFQLKNNVQVWASRARGQQPGWGETAAKWKAQSVEGHGGKQNQNNPEKRWLKTLEFSVSMKIPRKWRGGRCSNPGQGFHSSVWKSEAKFWSTGTA